MAKRMILIVDDEPTQRKIIGKFIDSLGHNYLDMSSGMEVVDFFMNKKTAKKTHKLHTEREKKAHKLHTEL